MLTWPKLVLFTLVLFMVQHNTLSAVILGQADDESPLQLLPSSDDSSGKNIITNTTIVLRSTIMENPGMPNQQKWVWSDLLSTSGTADRFMTPRMVTTAIQLSQDNQLLVGDVLSEIEVISYRLLFLISISQT